MEEYLNMIRPYLSNIIDDHKDGRKTQLPMEISFVSVIKSSDKGSNEPYIIYIYIVKIRLFLLVMKQAISLRNFLILF